MIKVIPFNNVYYKDVAKLIFQYRKRLGDDYINFDNMDNIIKYIEAFKQVIYVALNNDKFMGFCLFTDIYRNETENHSCFITGAVCRKIKPIYTREAFRKFIEILYQQYGFKKIYAKTNVDNLRAKMLMQDLRFYYEGKLKGDTMKDGELLTNFLWGKINSIYVPYIKKNKGDFRK